ncbi:hypothetical protein PR048_030092 [Dryococelus australis]|uniref:Uncharacterized protein n=1 Tax=Dryococelus australis TaxID=614101 RepID=A0ABQ9G7Y9_9NEOP|nr:hypothetical protein PR048_030092 [Dryococelus australis]
MQKRKKWEHSKETQGMQEHKKTTYWLPSWGPNMAAYWLTTWWNPIWRTRDRNDRVGSPGSKMAALDPDPAPVSGRSATAHQPPPNPIQHRKSTQQRVAIRPGIARVRFTNIEPAAPVTSRKRTASENYGYSRTAVGIEFYSKHTSLPQAELTLEKCAWQEGEDRRKCLQLVRNARERPLRKTDAMLASSLWGEFNRVCRPGVREGLAQHSVLPPFSRINCAFHSTYALSLPSEIFPQESQEIRSVPSRRISVGGKRKEYSALAAAAAEISSRRLEAAVINPPVQVAPVATARIARVRRLKTRIVRAQYVRRSDQPCRSTSAVSHEFGALSRSRPNKQKKFHPAHLPPWRSGFNPRPGHFGFSHVGIVPNVFSGTSRFLHPFIPALLHPHLNHPIGSYDLDSSCRNARPRETREISNKTRRPTASNSVNLGGRRRASEEDKVSLYDSGGSASDRLGATYQLQKSSRHDILCDARC